MNAQTYFNYLSHTPCNRHSLPAINDGQFVCWIANDFKSAFD